MSSLQLAGCLFFLFECNLCEVVNICRQRLDLLAKYPPSFLPFLQYAFFQLRGAIDL
jgi:hypothetical protein